MLKVSLRAKFLFLVAASFAVMLALTVRLTQRHGDFSAEAERLAYDLEFTSLLNDELRRGVREQLDILKKHWASSSPSSPEAFRRLQQDLAARQRRNLPAAGSPERTIAENIRRLQTQLGSTAESAFELLLRGDRAQARQKVEEAERLGGLVERSLDELGRLQAHKIQNAMAELKALVGGGRLAILGTALALVLVMAIFFFLLQRRVLRPISEVLRASEEIRKGNFTARAEGHGDDEIGRLARSFNFMADSLASDYAGLEQKVEERTGQLQSLQQKLVQAARMSAVGQLVSGVAHELNNPLTAIIGFSELQRLKLSRADNPNQAQIKVMDDILGQAERCRRIVANLLQFSRQREPHQEVIKINEVIEHVLQLREYELTTRDISLVRAYDPTSPRLSADPYKLQQVFLNLLNNAQDAIHETGRPGRIWIKTGAEDNRVRIEISDDGAGFKEPSRAFDPFYTTKEVGKGTGLGLSVCYGIIQEHGGAIWVENRDPGASVAILLPVLTPIVGRSVVNCQ